MSSSPMTHASNVKTILKQVRALPVAQSEAVLRAISRDVIEVIDRAASLGWVPIGYLAALAKGLVSGLNAGARQQFYRQVGAEVLKNPLAKSMVSFTAKITGVSPKSLIKLVPVFFRMQLQSAGDWEYRDHAKLDAELKWSEVPQVLVDYPPVFEIYVGTLEVVYSLCRVEGTIVAQVDAAKRGLSLRFAWNQ